jgi:ribose-phosphate pyrophosphokinase
VNALRAHGAAGEPIAVATHGLFAGSALPRLGECGIGRMVVTDSIAPRPAAAHAAPALSIQTESIAGLLAEAIDRLHHSEPLEELLLRG